MVDVYNNEQFSGWLKRLLNSKKLVLRKVISMRVATLPIFFLLILIGSSLRAQRLTPVVEEGQIITDELVIGPNDEIASMESTEDGIWMVGYFDNVNGVAFPGIVRWDGSSFELPNAESYPSEDFTAKGLFKASNGMYVFGEANEGTESIWFYNGTSWEAVPGSFFNNRVRQMVFYEGQLIVGGEFTWVNGVQADRVARFTNGYWENFGDGLDNRVADMMVHNGDLYICGRFTQSNSGPLNYIGVLTENGWSQVGAGLDDFARTFYYYNSHFLIGGRFSATADGTTEIQRMAEIVSSEIVPATFIESAYSGNSVLSFTELNGDLVVAASPHPDFVSESFVYTEHTWKESFWSIREVVNYEGKTYACTNAEDHETYFGKSSFFQYQQDGELSGRIANSEINATLWLFPNSTLSPDQKVRYLTQPFEDQVGTMFSHALWYGGMTENEVYVGFSDFQNTQGESTFGPYSSYYDTDYFARYFRTWAISRNQVEYHQNHWFDPNYELPEVIANWPGNGRVEYDESAHLAPFVDVNQNGWYEPLSGDYPLIYGDQCIMVISSDSRTLNEDQSAGMETVSLYFLVESEGPSERTMHVKNFITNKSENDYETFSIGVWADFDIGLSINDYVGSSPENDFFYGYNGEETDGPITISEVYGDNPPAQAVVFPNRELFSFMYFNNSGSAINGAATLPIHFYNYLNSTWKNGQPLLYGGDGANNANNPDSIVQFMYPHLATSTDPSDWNEITAGNPPADRRGVGAVAPFPLASGEQFCLDYLFTHAFGNEDSPFDEVIQLYNDVPVAIANYQDLNVACAWEQFPLTLNEEQADIQFLLYPNPTTGYVAVAGLGEGEYQADVYAVSGQIVLTKVLGGRTNRIETDRLASGVYLVQISKEEVLSTLKLIKY